MNEEFVYIGNGTSPLIGLINLSTVNQSVGFSIDIDPYEPKLSRERTCVIEMSGRIDYQENEYLTGTVHHAACIIVLYHVIS